MWIWCFWGELGCIYVYDRYCEILTTKHEAHTILKKTVYFLEDDNQKGETFILTCICLAESQMSHFTPKFKRQKLK